MKAESYQPYRRPALHNIMAPARYGQPMSVAPEIALESDADSQGADLASQNDSNLVEPGPQGPHQVSQCVSAAYRLVEGEFARRARIVLLTKDSKRTARVIGRANTLLSDNHQVILEPRENYTSERNQVPTIRFA
jgi:hypothetical protein